MIAAKSGTWRIAPVWPCTCGDYAVRIAAEGIAAEGFGDQNSTAAAGCKRMRVPASGFVDLAVRSRADGLRARAPLSLRTNPRFHL
jgi:hypothetical protein